MSSYVANIEIPKSETNSNNINFDIHGNTAAEAFHRLASTLQEIETDEDIIHLGYRCIGVIDEVYPELSENHLKNWYRTWIWENENRERIATWDNGNGFSSYMCGGTADELLTYFQTKARIESNA